MQQEIELLELTPEGGAVYVLHETEAVRRHRRQLREEVNKRFVFTEGQLSMLDKIRRLSAKG